MAIVAVQVILLDLSPKIQPVTIQFLPRLLQPMQLTPPALHLHTLRPKTVDVKYHLCWADTEGVEIVKCHFSPEKLKGIESAQRLKDNYAPNADGKVSRARSANSNTSIQVRSSHQMMWEKVREDLREEIRHQVSKEVMKSSRNQL